MNQETQSEAVLVPDDNKIVAGPKPEQTAAQAKVDAVAALTLSAYQKAATLELTPEESAKLQADFPDDAFQTGAAGKENLIYIEHAHLRDRFNSVFGMGKWAIVPRNRWAEPFVTQRGTQGERVYVEAMLVVRGCFVGEAVGAMEYYPKNESQNYGDAVEGAKTAAFRRCAKEFGVGLQAWKKEWCQGWWDRRKGVKPVQTPVSRPQTAPATPVTTPKPAKKSDVLPKEATAATRTWFLEELTAYESAEVMAYAQEKAILLPTEQFSDWPLSKVPTSKLALREWMKDFEDWRSTGLKNMNPPEYDQTEAFWDVIVPIPHKGEKRDEYLKNPDTIRSLYDAMKTGDGDAQSRLWGFANHYQPKGWTKKDGTEMPPGDADLKFREALDAFIDWEAAKQ